MLDVVAVARLARRLFHFQATRHGRFTRRYASASDLSQQAKVSHPALFRTTRRKLLDSGDWMYAAEWWGRQGDSWGSDYGDIVFNQLSEKWNGQVSVTSHPASTSGLDDWSEVASELEKRQKEDSGFEVVGCEWRVLRFNEVTRQSVAKVILVQDPNVDSISLLQIPSCLAFEYLKSMIAVGLGSISCAGMDLRSVVMGDSKMHALCIGLGGGSLPLFLANKLQGCHVEVVEIDRTVISAATEFMGFPTSAFKDMRQSTDFPILGSSVAFSWGGFQERISGFQADGTNHVCELLQKLDTSSCIPYYDIVFIDAFDGKDQVPFSLWNRNGPFLSALDHLLHPVHGTVVVNLHTDMEPPSLLERLTGEFGPGYDPALPMGKQLLSTAHAYKDTLLSIRDGNSKAGIAFTVAVPRQQNICLTVARNISGTGACVLENINDKAFAVESMLNAAFSMSKRTARGFTVIT